VVRWQENSSFVNFGLQGWLAAVCKCAVLWAGFLLSLRGGGRKNKINSPQTAPPYQRSTNPVNPFYVIISIFIYRINVSSWWFSTLSCPEIWLQVNIKN
jgi:hypothetical protein